MNQIYLIHFEFITMIITLIGGLYLMDGKIERQGQRTDRLYEMFIELIKENREKK